jgi:uncharacterized membrane protein
MRLASLVVVALVAGLAGPAFAQDKSSAYKGLWISTPYPAFNVTSKETVTLDLTVHNAGLPPQRVALGLSQVPQGWTGTFLGGGNLIESVFVAPDGEASIKLRLEPPANAAKGSYHFEIAATGHESKFALPIDLTVGDTLPPKLSMKSELPTLRGSSSSTFEYKLKIKNDGGGDAVVRLDAQTAPAFQVKFTEEYGSQELTSFPLKAGDEKTISAKLSLPQSTKAGTYPIVVQASTGQTEAQVQLGAEVTGQPKLLLTGQGERLSAQAIAGEGSPVEMTLTNTGSAPAHNVKVTASEPSGWKVSFDPATFDVLAANANQTVKATITPSSKAIAGDYMVTVSASGDGVNASSDFRVTVRTSTMWGIVGVLVIAAALIVLVLAVVRYGRR